MKRCKHEIVKKEEYPADRICLKCHMVWHIPKYLDAPEAVLKLLPKEIKVLVLKNRKEIFSMDAPEFKKSILS